MRIDRNSGVGLRLVSQSRLISSGAKNRDTGSIDLLLHGLGRKQPLTGTLGPWSGKTLFRLFGDSLLAKWTRLQTTLLASANEKSCVGLAASTISNLCASPALQDKALLVFHKENRAVQ